MADYDWQAIEQRREEGETWPDIAPDYGVKPSTIRKAYSRYRGNAKDATPADQRDRADVTDPVLLTRDDIARITALEDLLDFFEVDTEAWMVDNFRVNKWEQASGGGDDVTITPLYQVRANLRRNVKRDLEIAQTALEQAVDDMKTHAPVYDAPAEIESLAGDVLFELAIMDPHLAMLAWGQEVGESYDLDIAIQDYAEAVDYLLGLASHYDVERILYVVGNDMLHVDTIMDKVATTTSGTPQDFDSRLPKVFTAARRAAVNAINAARRIAPVDVMVVAGNHDEQSMYRLGEVLHAWYRNDNQVNVLNAPRLRKYYRYGENLLGFTHGLEFKRRREPLPFIMADEAPQLWADTTYREIHCGHYHSTKERKYMSPSMDLNETRGVRVRALPGLTPVDAWHFGKGYRHTRAATALAFKRSGGIAGLHEFYPQKRGD